ncbi:histidine ammonia-lyase [Ornithinimicrobium faecis]|uniref:histidine ammonia-lyase n=1 Tax=Ornithinimicrobium faecis TaxID=2934158 RepID=UPI0021182311|nr:histidine ammonia-lyase [Ornithinimicrobium sp. HY1745]
MTTTYTLTGDDVDLQDLAPAYAGPIQVSIADSAWAKVDAAYAVISGAVERGDVVYGVNTGFGKLADRRIAPDDLKELQRRVIASHMTGVGDPLEPALVRATMLVKLIGLLRGHSGVRRLVVQQMVDMLNRDALPVIPGQGSVGASGDLAPLSHMAGAMIGLGHIRVGEDVMPAVDGLAAVGLEPIVLGPKEGVALINGTQASTAITIRGLLRAQEVLNAAVAAGALTTEATAGRQTAFDDRIQQIRRQPGQIAVADQLRRLVADSDVLSVEFEGRRLQDPYCLRCQPQVMGAALDLLDFAAGTLGREINAVSDNPLMFPDDDLVLSGGNFHGQPVAFAADVIAMALCEIGSLSERRTAMLMDTSMSGLPPFLIESAGLSSGFMLAQVTSAALVAENRSRAMPNSVDSIPTSAGQEDHVSMATHAGLRLSAMGRNTAYVVAIELLSGAQGLDLRNGGKPAPALASTYELVRSQADFLEEDRVMSPDMEAVCSQVLSGAFNDIVGISVGERA